MSNKCSRRTLIGSGPAAAGVTLIGDRASALRQAPPNLKVVVSSEGTAPKNIYPNDVNTAIADGLMGLAGWDVVTASLNDPDQGITDELFNSTSTLIWFGSLRHNDVNDDLVAKIVKRVREGGMGFIATHSSHFSKPLKQLLGTRCGWKYYVDDGSKLAMNGVPARIVSGNFVEQKDAHHILTLVWLESVGWIPVEPTAVTSNKREDPARKFGNWGGTMLNSNVNIGYSVPVNGTSRYIGTLDSLWLLGANGQDESTREHVCTRI